MKKHWHIAVVGLLAMAFGAAFNEHNANVAKANAVISEQQVNHALPQPTKLHYPDLAVTCLWWPDVKEIACIPDYQLNTRKKYEG